MIGEIFLADGNTPPSGRQAKTGEAVVVQAHGKYYEAASRGRLAGGSTSAGVATTTSISTTSMISLYNPITSQYRLALKKISAGYHSGTLGAGTLFHCINPVTSGTANPTQPSGGTSITTRFSSVMAALGRSPVAELRSGSTVVAPNVWRPFCSVNAILASTATGMFLVVEDLDGEIVLDPGGCYQVQSVCAAGTSPLINLGLVWEEIPLLLPVR